MNQDVPSSRLHQEHFDWLSSKQTSKQQKLAAIKNLVAQYPDDFDETKELVEGLQTDVAYCENILEYLKKNFNQQCDGNESEDGIYSEDNEDNEDKNNHEGEDNDDNNYLTEKQLENFVQQPVLEDLMPRDPMDMLRSKYKGMQMLEIIDSILNDYPDKLSSEEVTKIAYDTNSNTEFERAKASMSTQLRYGAGKGKWLKVGRGYFVSHHTRVAPKHLSDDELEEILVNNGRSH
ncbi:hypothetical protein [Nostoc sp.]|uniref:hypothetical protein n=1 Tax=Nostoc sp. TaxID=1180 RepID=UPI002FFD4328